MKKLTVLLLSVLFVVTRGYLIKVPTVPVIQPKFAPVGWVYMQKLILPLFENICEESKNPTVIKLSQDFKLDTTNADFARPEVIKNLLDLKNSKGLLPKNEIFTEYKYDYLNELKVIYEVLYYAKDFEAFYKAACWARQNINCGLFVDALYSVILNRKDTENVFLPAPYEVLPNYFIRKDFIIKASSLIADGEITPSEFIRNDGNSYILDANYTTQFYDNPDESKLVYFYEDIGLNTYYYLEKLKLYSSINSYSKDNRHGEYLYFMIKQLMARYNLERYSNGLPELETIDWNYLNTIPYYDPMLIYSDGNEFSHRTFKQIENNDKITLIKTIENNLATVVTHMREGGFNKSGILNHLMEMVITGDKSYENLALQILNDDITDSNRPPTVLGHFMTTLRDPAFWAINKKIVDTIDKALKVLPGYTKDELYFPGVEIINVEVKKMSTYFDNFVFDVTDALKTGDDNTKFNVKIGQSRLNHKPFSIKVNITSLVSQRGLLRIFLGPKIMPGEHVLKKNLFMLLDCFEVNLKFGSNIVTRTSADISDISDDLLSLYTIRKRISDAEFGLVSSMKLKTIEEQIKFPSRLLIPKGLTDGLPLQIFVFVVPFGKALGGRLTNTEINKSALPSPGFPLDLEVEVQQLFDLPNALVKDIYVTHKETSDQTTNYGGRPGVKSWSNNEYENFQTSSESVILPLAARPDFTLRKEPIDYKSKRGQYGKSVDYAVKRGDYKYKKDYTKVEDRPSITNNNKYVTNSEMTTKKIATYIPDTMIDMNKKNYEYVITTDRSFGGGNTFFLDKKVQDKGINEEVHIDVTDKEKTVPDKMETDIDKITHKVVINDGIYDDIISDETIPGSDEKMWKKVNKHKIIDVTNEDKKLSDPKTEEFHEKTDFSKVDNNGFIDISKTTTTNKRFPSFYDLLFHSSDVIIGPDEKLYA